MNSHELVVVGAGKVGVNLIRLASARGLSALLVCEELPSAAVLAELTTSGVQTGTWDQVQDVSTALTLLAVPESSLSDVGRSMLHHGVVSEVTCVTSGSVSLEAAGIGVEAARFHPAFSFRNPMLPLAELAGMNVLVEGTQKAGNVIRPIASKMGLRVVHVGSLDPLLYHAACVLAANGTGLLALVAASLLSEAGVGTAEEAAGILESLVGSGLATMREPNPAGVITGPASRGDLGILLQEYNRLAKSSLSAASLYSRINVLIAEMVGHHGIATELSRLSGTPPQ